MFSGFGLSLVSAASLHWAVRYHFTTAVEWMKCACVKSLLCKCEFWYELLLSLSLTDFLKEMIAQTFSYPLRVLRTGYGLDGRGLIPCGSEKSFSTSLRPHRLWGFLVSCTVAAWGFFIWRKAYCLPPSSAEVKNPWSYTSATLFVFMTCSLIKHRDKYSVILKALRKPRQ
jgi:hypothetical protein